MSLETQLEALNAQVEVLNDLIAKAIHIYAPGAAGAKVEKPKRAAEDKPAEPKAEKAEPVAEEKPASSDWTEATLKKALVALVNVHGRVAMEDLLAKFGATKFSELPADKYADVGAAIEAKREE
jgi:hypothetical protein